MDLLRMVELRVVRPEDGELRGPRLLRGLSRRQHRLHGQGVLPQAPLPRRVMAVPRLREQGGPVPQVGLPPEVTDGDLQARPQEPLADGALPQGV